MNDIPLPPDPRGDLLVKATIGIVILIIVLVFALVFASAFGLKPDQSFMTLVGQVVATSLGLGTAVWAWQFASSKGSQDKTAQITAMSTPPISPPVASSTDSTTLGQTKQGVATGIVIQPTT